MIDNVPPAAPTTNRAAVISAVAALLTLVSLCTAVAPVPLTGYICYPAAILMGLIALISGVAALAQIRATGQSGRVYALMGVWTGGLVFVAVLCAAALGVILFPRVANLIHGFVR